MVLARSGMSTKAEVEKALGPGGAVETLDDGRLPSGDVTVAVEYSTLNFKDALAINKRFRALLRQRLQQQGGFADAGITAHQHGGARHQSAAAAPAPKKKKRK